MAGTDTGYFDTSITGFLALKRSLGYLYLINESHLENLKRFITERYPDAQSLDEEIVVAWAARRDDESSASIARRISTIREFARYLISIGDEAYILPGAYTPKTTRYIPHSFTRDEIGSFFRALDQQFLPKDSDLTRHFDARAAFRIMYCCGLRPGEVTGLKREDVDLVFGRLFIKDTKGRRERVAPFDEGLRVYLSHYDNEVCGIENRTHFICGKNGGSRKAVEIGHWFREIWDVLCGFGITQHNKARAYDLRHHHPSRRLKLWMDEGVDIASKQVYLMAYMGHKQFKETDYYIHLTEDMFDHLTQTMEEIGSVYWHGIKEDCGE